MPHPADKKQVVAITIAMLLLAAVVVLLIPRLPMPLRITVACADLIGAAIVFVALRQQKPGA